MKKLTFCILLVNALFAQKELVDCNMIFDERKEEITREIEKVEEEKQSFEAYKDATNELLNKREVKIKEKEQIVSEILDDIKDRHDRIKKILDENKKLMNEIEKLKDNKISETFAKMKASKAAPILDAMEPSKAASILFNLDPKVLGKLLSKMDANKASTVTDLIKKGPPFKAKEVLEYEQNYLKDKIEKSGTNEYKPTQYIDNTKDPEALEGMQN